MDCGRPDVKLHSTTLSRLCIDISSCNFMSFEEMLSALRALPDFTADLKDLIGNVKIQVDVGYCRGDTINI